MYQYILVILLPFMLILISSCTRIHISNDKERLFAIIEAKR